MNEDLLLRRLWAKIDKRADGCWIWRGCPDTEYGVIERDGKNVKVHRLMYQLFKGEIPQGHEVRHSCHNRPCCNPEHLSTGTRTDNMRDKMIAGRHRIGRIDPEIHGEMMRRAWAAYTPEQRIERVKRVSVALKGKSFTDEHLNNLRASPANQKGRAPRAFGAQLPQTALTADQVLEIRNKYAQGFKQEQLSYEYGIGREAIANIIRGISYKWVATGRVQREVGYGTKQKSILHPHGNTGKTHPGRVYTEEQLREASERKRRWWANKKAKNPT